MVQWRSKKPMALPAPLRLSVCIAQSYKPPVSMSNKALMATDRHLPETIGPETIGPQTIGPQTIGDGAADRMQAASCSACSFTRETEELVRDLMVRFGDKWSLRVMDELYENGAMRFSRLRERLPGISQKMLTQTLRQLERDGVVIRRVYAEVPPRVDYELTAAGIELSEALCGVWEWAIRHGAQVDAARAVFDAQAKVPPKAE
jgi:DNA-binding HxlR family transcriptional regulator